MPRRTNTCRGHLSMALRELFRPLRPDLDRFLFAPVGAEQNGIPLSMVSALTRLGLDPWDEAGRLSSLGKREAVEQLARLIAELPDTRRPLAEAREIACELVEQLPKHDSDHASPSVQVRRRYRWPSVRWRSQLLTFCLVFAAAALVSIMLHGGFSLGMGSP
jgi:hypothetical protein